MSPNSNGFCHCVSQPLNLHVIILKKVFYCYIILWTISNYYKHKSIPFLSYSKLAHRNENYCECYIQGIATVKSNVNPWQIWHVLYPCFCSVTKLCLTLCDPMDCSMPGLPVPHHLLHSTQVHIHLISDVIQLVMLTTSSRPNYLPKGPIS